MTYKIEISPTAIADVEAIFLWLKEYSADRAYRWVRGCYEIMLKLETFPNRCALAVESQHMELAVRQLLYEQQYRILFTVHETNDEHEGVVRIHRVIHASQERLQDIDQVLGD
ncbi:MAG: type II toxin-antitoxin system RelE/ParE family toxin [Phormidium sp.]